MGSIDSLEEQIKFQLRVLLLEEYPGFCEEYCPGQLIDGHGFAVSFQDPTGLNSEDFQKFLEYRNELKELICKLCGAKSSEVEHLSEAFAHEKSPFQTIAPGSDLDESIAIIDENGQWWTDVDNSDRSEEESE